MVLRYYEHPLASRHKSQPQSKVSPPGVLLGPPLCSAVCCRHRWSVWPAQILKVHWASWWLARSHWPLLYNQGAASPHRAPGKAGRIAYCGYLGKSVIKVVNTFLTQITDVFYRFSEEEHVIFTQPRREGHTKSKHLFTNLNCEWFNIYNTVFSSGYVVCLELFLLSLNTLAPFSFLGLFFMVNLKQIISREGKK